MSTLVLDRLPELLAFDAPYLVEKLVHRGAARDADEARALFQEVKKYLVLTTVHSELAIPMFSRRVDDAWHQLVLFTREYAAFSREHFGRFVDHTPREESGGAPAGEPIELARFEQLYSALFGELSPLWRDAHGMRASSHVAKRRWGKPMTVRRSTERAELVLLREPPVVLCAVSPRAAAALAFAIEIPAFYVRELPGLAADEQIALAALLVDLSVLDVSP